MNGAILKRNEIIIKVGNEDNKVYLARALAIDQTLHCWINFY